MKLGKDYRADKMQSNILSKSYAQETAPERRPSFRGESNVIYINGGRYKEEAGLPRVNYRAASSSVIGSNIHGEVMATSDELAKANIAAAEARTDTKIARMEGKLDLVLTKLDATANHANSEFVQIGNRLTEVRNDVRADYAATRTNLWVVFAGIMGLIVAIALL